MKDAAHTGEWFLPGCESKYPGSVFLNKEKNLIKLKLYGPKSIEGRSVIAGLNSDPEHFHSFILGTGAFSEKITLYNCELREVETIGKDLAEINYEAEFIFTGAHISNKEELFVESGTFVFPYLSSWYDGDQSLNKLNGGRSGLYFSDDKELEKKLNSPKEPVPENLAINENLTLVFWERLEKRVRQVGVHYDVKFQKYISFTYSTVVPFKQLLKDAAIFGRLLAFCISEPLVYEIQSIKMTGAFMENQKFFLDHYSYSELLVSNFSLSKGKNVRLHSLHQNSQIISKWTFTKEMLNQIIVTWYSNKHLFHVYDYYNDSNNWFQDSEAILTNVMFNNRFLNIIQGLEDYYRKTAEAEKPDVIRFNEQKEKVLSLIQDAELRNWINDSLKPPKQIGLEKKLLSLITRFTDIIETLYRNKEIIRLFPQQATIRRHRLSHGNTKETSQGVELELYFYFGRVLLAICILESLKVTDIVKRIDKCYRLNDKIHLLNRIKLVVRKNAKS